MNLTSNQNYPMCNCSREDMLQVARDCQVSINFWNPSSCLGDKSIDWGLLFVVAVNLLWINRNEVMFN